jgi:hypothetical protein
VNGACGEPIEIDLHPSELLALAAEADDDPISVDIGGEAVALRKPTGGDQLLWQARALGDEAAALRTIAADLVVPSAGTLDDAAVTAVEHALAQRDPLVCLELSVACPCCHEVHDYEFDVLDLALARFGERQAELLGDVHVLASHYHWTEAAIAAVPHGRRARYLALIDAGRP